MKNLESISSILFFSSHNFGSKDVRTTMLMGQFAEHKKVYFIETPIQEDCTEPSFEIRTEAGHSKVVQPYLPKRLTRTEEDKAMISIIRQLMKDEGMFYYALWTDTPKCVPIIRYLTADVIIYDCIINNKIAPKLEKELIEYADVVLTSGKINKSKNKNSTKESKNPELQLFNPHNGGVENFFNHH